MRHDRWLMRALLAFVAVVLLAPLARARGEPDGLAVVAMRELPAEARQVLAHIEAGGPFKYDRDGVVFGNRERILPGRPRGYYHEYTVPTPGAHNRGARRIVCGGPKRAPDACFYTDDHYQTFRRIVP
jgi:ribonuclease T1